MAETTSTPVSNTTHTGVPTQVTTTVSQPPNHVPVADRSFTGSDIAWILGLVVTIIVIVTAVYKLIDWGRARNDKTSTERANSIIEKIESGAKSTTDSMKLLEDRLRDRDSQLEKDLDNLRIDKEHFRNNIKTNFDAIEHKFSRHDEKFHDLHTRLTTQEEKTSNNTTAISRIEQLINAKFDETKVLIKDLGTAMEKQVDKVDKERRDEFAALATSIREISKREPKV